MQRVLTAVMLLSAALAGSVKAQRVDVRASVDSTRVGERFLLTVTALHAYSEAPTFPDPRRAADAFGDLEDVRIVSAGHMLLGPAARQDSMVYDVTTFALDRAEVPALVVSFGGTSRRDSTRPMLIPVVSVVPADADTIRDMAAPVVFLEPDSRSAPPWPWVMLGLGVAVLLGALWMWYARRRTEVVSDDGPQPPSQSPYEAAVARLATLEAADLTVAGSEVPYFVELSEAVRMYLELRIGIPALELTTAEVLDEFSHVRYKIPGGVPDQVRAVLGLSDLVKFAEFRPLPADSTQTLGQARHVVERLEEKQRQLALDAARQKEVIS